MRGCIASARAIATRWRSPPLSSAPLTAMKSRVLPAPKPSPEGYEKALQRLVTYGIFAWTLNPKTSIRGGYFLVYDRIGSGLCELETQMARMALEAVVRAGSQQTERKVQGSSLKPVSHLESRSHPRPESPFRRAGHRPEGLRNPARRHQIRHLLDTEQGDRPGKARHGSGQLTHHDPPRKARQAGNLLSQVYRIRSLSRRTKEGS